MRAYDVFLFFTICVQLSLWFCSTFGVFGATPFSANAQSAIINKNLTDLNQFNDTMSNSVTSYASSTASSVTGIGFIIGALTSFGNQVPELQRIFGIPYELAMIFQVILWFIFIIGLIGWITGRHPDNAN